MEESMCTIVVSHQEEAQRRNGGDGGNEGAPREFLWHFLIATSELGL